MKKTLMILGAIFCIVLMVMIGFTIYGLSVGPGLDKESKAWVDGIVPQIVSVWDTQKLIENSVPNFLETISKEKVETTFAQLSSELGPLKKYKGSQGEAGIRFNNGKKTFTAEYIAEGDFEKGSAQISIVGIKIENTWKILKFNVSIHTTQ